ncbi:hypothetical protein OIU79_015283, partial [Salix purpurea]
MHNHLSAHSLSHSLGYPGS